MWLRRSGDELSLRCGSYLEHYAVHVLFFISEPVFHVFLVFGWCLVSILVNVGFTRITVFSLSCKAVISQKNMIDQMQLLSWVNIHSDLSVRPPTGLSDLYHS